MPQVPRGYSSTRPATPEFNRPKAPPPIPVHSADDRSPTERRLSGDRLDMKKFDKDPAEIARILFGKEPVVDEHTGQLVFPVAPRPAGPPAHGPGA